MVEKKKFSRVDQLIKGYGSLNGYSISQKFNMKEFLNSVAHNIRQKLDNNKESIEKLDTELKSYLIMNEKYTNLSGFIADKMLDMIYEDFTNNKGILSESLLQKTQNFGTKDWEVQKEIVKKINNIIKKYNNITIKDILEEFGKNIKDKKSREFFQKTIKDFKENKKQLEENIYEEIKDENLNNRKENISQRVISKNPNNKKENISQRVISKNPNNKEDGIYEEINFENTKLPNTTMNHTSSKYQELNKTNKNPN